MGFWDAHGARRFIGVAIGLAALAAPGLGAAQAAAATLTVNKPCYVNTLSARGPQAARMVVTGTGYIPGSTVNIASTDGTVFKAVQANASGVIIAIVGAPTPSFSRPGSRALGLVATDQANTSIVGGTFLKVADLAVATVPSKAKPSRKVVWYFSGFRPGQYVYGHYLRNGREVARARFGRAKGVCGLVRVGARFFPGGHQRYRHYGLQFDDSRRYHRGSRPRIVTSLNTS